MHFHHPNTEQGSAGNGFAIACDLTLAEENE
jgi:hypothetical protein